MIVFRFEHNRDVCEDSNYNANSDSPTGHGPQSGICNYNRRPNFGGTGNGPKSITKDERCAVTLDQFNDWIAYSYKADKCDFSSEYCEGEQTCYQCAKKEYVIKLNSDWDLVAYELDNFKEGITWHFDNNQVVFNPKFASKRTIIDVVAEFGNIIKVKIDA